MRSIVAVEGSLAGASRMFSGIRMACRICLSIGLWGAEPGATGQSTELEPELAEEALVWGRENLKPQFRGTAFGPEVRVPENAPVYDRLAGFFGRTPG